MGPFSFQVQYKRRDIAQRLRTTDLVNHLSGQAIARALTKRQRTVAGLDPPGFYDA